MELEIYNLIGELIDSEPNDIINTEPVFEQSARFEMVQIGLSEVFDG